MQRICLILLAFLRYHCKSCHLSQKMLIARTFQPEFSKSNLNQISLFLRISTSNSFQSYLSQCSSLYQRTTALSWSLKTLIGDSSSETNRHNWCVDSSRCVLRGSSQGNGQNQSSTDHFCSIKSNHQI